MKTFKREGKSEAAVVTAFMKELGLKKGEFSYQIIDEGSKGFFSLFGAKPVVIKFTINAEDDELKLFLDGLFDRIGVEYQTMDIQRRGRNVNINISGVNERGFVIGKEGRMLESIQHLAYRLLMKNEKEEITVRLDVDGYRKKHEKMLTDYLQAVIEKVKRTGKGITLDPLYTSDRKFVYRTLEKDAAVKSVTLGNGQKKRIQILPADAEIPVRNEGDEGEPARRSDRPRGERSDSRRRNDRPRGERRPQETSSTAGEGGEASNENQSSRPPRGNRPYRGRPHHRPRGPREPRPNSDNPSTEARAPRPESDHGESSSD